MAEIEHKEKKNDKNKVDLEVTWNLGLEKKANKLVKEKMKSKDTLTPFEQFLKKRKEKRLKKKEERKKKHEDVIIAPLCQSTKFFTSFIFVYFF